MTRLAIDMSSYLKTALRTGKDLKDGQIVIFEDEEVLVNSAEYGYEIFTNMMVKTLQETGLNPIDCILVFEGMNSKQKRLLVDPGYKGKRDKKPPQFYDEFNRLKDFVRGQWKMLGATVMTQAYAEADDTLAWLARESEEDLIIASRDADLGACCTDDGCTNDYGATVRTYNDGLLGAVKLDGEPWVHPYRFITLYKALVGDSSDSVPGVKGFGAAAFQKLAEKYGYDGLDELMGLLNQGDLGPLYELIEAPEHKLIKKIVEAEADAIRCWRLVKMYPEWVNTMRHPLVIEAGKNEPEPADVDERLKHWYGSGYLVTADNYDQLSAFFRKEAARSPELVFDIESSTPPESDEWLEAQPKGKGEKGSGVDQLGQELTGFSFTFGPNLQHTIYVSVDHRDTNNLTMSQARKLIEIAIDSGLEIVIHNTFFELSVLAMAEDEDGTKWLDAWKDKGARGFVPRVLDTKMEASYVDENRPLGLKFRSKHHLGYEQQSYEATTTKEGWVDDLPDGGRVVFEREEDDGRIWQKRQYKMNELTAEEVFGYGCDDTINTAALHRYFKLVMQLEHTYRVYLETEIDAAYQHAKNFVDGIPFSLQLSKELEAHDTATYDKAWATVRAYLIKMGWAGTVPPTYTPSITAKEIKEAYKIITGVSDEAESEAEADEADEEGGERADAAESDDEGVEAVSDPFLASRVRTPAKLAILARECGHETFAGMVELCLSGDEGAAKFTTWVRSKFSGEPLFKVSNKQMQKLLYEVMALPVRVRGKPTKKMIAKGLQGNPKGDALAIEYAFRDCNEEQKSVLEGLKLMSMVRTRRSLYYTKYPYFIHWKTGRIHPTHNQCATNTRRASEAKPNKQQLPKHPKISGEPARFRETIIPHHPDAVVVSLDFDSQELRIIADYSQDANLVACYVGDNKKDVHSLTGHQILVKKKPEHVHMSYEVFVDAVKDKNNEHNKVCKEFRALGKKVNFTTEFGAMAPKLAMTMLVTESEAQIFIDAKERMFPGVRKWKDATIAEAKRFGFVCTKDGAVRHLRELLEHEDPWIRSKAERQAVNTKVQGSAGAMTKRAEGRMWQIGLVYKYDAVCYGPVHDEVVFSVMKKDLVEFLKDAHWCMTQPFADMTVPVESSISFGPSFGEQYEIGLEPTPEAVAFGYEQWEKAHAEAA